MTIIGLLQSFSHKSERLNQALNVIGQSPDFRIETIDNFSNYESVIQAVWGLINLVDVLVADVSREDTNVLYEIGLAHGLGKPVIIITEDEFYLPADLRGQRAISISKNTSSEENFTFRLTEAINQIVKKGNKFTGLKGPREERPNYVPSNSSPNINFRDIYAFEGGERAKLLEDWLFALAESIDGWEAIRSPPRDHNEGFDIVIWNSIEDVDLNILGNPIAVEIKTIGNLDTTALNSFLRKSRKSGLKGLIFASSSVNSVNTKRSLSKLRLDEGISAIALDREDFINVISPYDLIKIIKMKIRELLYREKF